MKRSVAYKDRSTSLRVESLESRSTPTVGLFYTISGFASAMTISGNYSKSAFRPPVDFNLVTTTPSTQLVSTVKGSVDSDDNSIVIRQSVTSMPSITGVPKQDGTIVGSANVTIGGSFSLSEDSTVVFSSSTSRTDATSRYTSTGGSISSQGGFAPFIYDTTQGTKQIDLKAGSYFFNFTTIANGSVGSDGSSLSGATAADLVFQLNVKPKTLPDIVVQSAQWNSASSNVSFVYTTTDNPGKFSTGLYLSHDLAFDSSDSLIAATTVDPGSNATGTGQFNLSSTPLITADRPYLIVVANPANTVPELRLDNNTAAVRYRSFDRDQFFTNYQMQFPSEKLTLSQYTGLNKLLDMIELDKFMNNPNWIAYLLATTKREAGNGVNYWNSAADEGVLASGTKVKKDYFDIYEPGTVSGKNLGNTEVGDGYLYRGRGYSQLTGRYSYSRFGKVLGYDLETNPDLVFDPVVSYNVTSYGLRFGYGRKDKVTKQLQTLEKFTDGDNFDFFGAREIINGDKNSLVDKKDSSKGTIGQQVQDFAIRLKAITRASITNY